jgi:nucleoid-associated protein YgaU
MSRPVLLIRASGMAIVAGTGCAASIGALSWATRGVLREVQDRGSFDALIGLAAACGAWAALLWLGTGFAVAVLAALPGAAGSGWQRLASRIAPPGIRRAAGFLVGALIVTGGVAGTALPAAADTARPAVTAGSTLPNLDRPVSTGSTESTESTVASPRPTVSRSTEPGPPGRDPTPPFSNEQDRSPVVVVKGDTLWDIAAARLGAGATNSEIAAEWPRWYGENREVIGHDPDLILPGQRLLPPRP